MRGPPAVRSNQSAAWQIAQPDEFRAYQILEQMIYSGSSSMRCDCAVPNDFERSRTDFCTFWELFSTWKATSSSSLGSLFERLLLDLTSGIYNRFRAPVTLLAKLFIGTHRRTARCDQRAAIPQLTSQSNEMASLEIIHFNEVILKSAY